MEQKPSVGRVVHYVSYGTPGGEYTSECRAAIITSVGVIDQVSLAVLNPTGMFFNECVEHYMPKQGVKGYRGGTWHWPERV